jgi:hypothetical protein
MRLRGARRRAGRPRRPRRGWPSRPLPHPKTPKKAHKTPKRPAPRVDWGHGDDHGHAVQGGVVLVRVGRGHDAKLHAGKIGLEAAAQLDAHGARGDPAGWGGWGRGGWGGARGTGAGARWCRRRPRAERGQDPSSAAGATSRAAPGPSPAGPGRGRAPQPPAPRPRLALSLCTMASRVGPIHVAVSDSASPGAVALSAGSAPRSIVVDARPSASVVTCWGAPARGFGAPSACGHAWMGCAPNGWARRRSRKAQHAPEAPGPPAGGFGGVGRGLARARRRTVTVPLAFGSVHARVTLALATWRHGGADARARVCVCECVCVCVRGHTRAGRRSPGERGLGYQGPSAARRRVRQHARAAALWWNTFVLSPAKLKCRPHPAHPSLAPFPPGRACVPT